MTNKKPKFGGTRIEKDGRILTVGTLRGNFGEAVFEEYIREIGKYPGRAIQALNTTHIELIEKEDNGKELCSGETIISATSSLSNIIINNLPIIKEEGLHVATLQDLYFMLRTGDPLVLGRRRVSDEHRTVYVARNVSAGLIFPSKPEVWMPIRREGWMSRLKYIEKTLVEDIKQRMGQEPQYPFMINDADLRVEPDKNGPYGGIVLKLAPDAHIDIEGYFKTTHGAAIEKYIKEQKAFGEKLARIKATWQHPWEPNLESPRWDFTIKDIDPETGFPKKRLGFENSGQRVVRSYDHEKRIETTETIYGSVNFGIHMTPLVLTGDYEQLGSEVDLSGTFIGRTTVLVRHEVKERQK